MLNGSLRRGGCEGEVAVAVQGLLAGLSSRLVRPLLNRVSFLL